jgi:hypothetical protein
MISSVSFFPEDHATPDSSSGKCFISVQFSTTLTKPALPMTTMTSPLEMVWDGGGLRLDVSDQRRLPSG